MALTEVLNVKRCPRCGEEHLGLVFHLRVWRKRGTSSHFAFCPKGQRIDADIRIELVDYLPAEEGGAS